MRISIGGSLRGDNLLVKSAAYRLNILQSKAWTGQNDESCMPIQDIIMHRELKVCVAGLHRFWS